MSFLVLNFFFNFVYLIPKVEVPGYPYGYILFSLFLNPCCLMLWLCLSLPSYHLVWLVIFSVTYPDSDPMDL